MMAEDCYLVPKGALMLKHLRRYPHKLRFLLPAVLMCSVYISFICLKQIKVQFKPEILQTKLIEAQPPYDPSIVRKQKEIQIDPGFKMKETVEQHPYDPRNNSLELSETQIKSHIVSMKPIDQPTNNFSIVGLKGTEIQIKPESMTTTPKLKQHSYDPKIVGLNQANVKLKPVSERTKPVPEHPYGRTTLGLNQTHHPQNPTPVGLIQTELQINPEPVRTEIVQKPCQNPDIPKSELPYVHYPVPTTYSRRECACTPVRFYVIVTMQRSGSKWLESLLNNHVNISSNGEIFIDRERSSNISILTSTLHKVYNLDWRNSVNRRRCVAAVGFKWMLNQRILTYHKEVSKYFTQRGVSVIFLFRRNQLRRIISLIANSQDHSSLNGTHKAHIFTQQEADLLASYKPILKPKSLIRKLRLASSRASEAIEHFKSLRHMVLYYEDLVKNNTKLADVMDFLHVPQRKLQSLHVKIHTKPLSEMVQNWSSIRKALKGTQFESFLSSDDV